MRKKFGFTLIELLVVIALVGCPLLCRSVTASPRLLETYIPSGGGFATLPDTLSFVFSEPIDPVSVTPPNATNSNPDRSYEIVVPNFDGSETPFSLGGNRAVALDNGQLIMILGSGTTLTGRLTLRLFRDGFRNLKGEPLDKDYEKTTDNCETCPPAPYPMVRLYLPTSYQATTDPNEAISVYFTCYAPPDLVRAELLSATDGSSIKPLDLQWDTAGQIDGIEGFLHLRIGHPALSPNSYFVRLHIKEYGPYPSDPNFEATFDLPFTVASNLKGDLNGNGKVDIGDATLALRAAVGLISLTSQQLEAAGVAPGDKINVQNAILILRLAIGLISDLPTPVEWP